MSTVLVPYEPNYYDGLEKNHADFHMEQFKQGRRSLLSELRCLTGLPEIVRSLNPETLYKVVIPKGQLLQQGKDGLFRGVIYSDQGITQHVKFTEVRPSLLHAATAIGSQVLLISIAMQLNRIENKVEKLSIEMHEDRIAEISAGIEQFEKAMLIEDNSLQREFISNAVQTLHTGIEKTIRDLRRRIAEAPDPKSSIWDYVPHWEDKTEKAAKIMGLAEESFHALLHGIKTLAECYAVLGEMKAASEIISKYLDKIQNCNIKAAAEKARLIEFSGPVAPQKPWETFIEVYLAAKKQLEQISSVLKLEKGRSTIEIEFMPLELKLFALIY